jgi:hypothetical protein
MKNPWILRQLTVWMASREIPDSTIDEFHIYWNELAMDDHLPCPNCFQAGLHESLLVMGETGQYEPLICTRCRTEFNIPIQ